MGDLLRLFLLHPMACARHLVPARHAGGFETGTPGGASCRHLSEIGGTRYRVTTTRAPGVLPVTPNWYSISAVAGGWVKLPGVVARSRVRSV